MLTRHAATAATMVLAACSGGTPLSRDLPPQEVPQSGVETSHRMRSIDEALGGRKYLKEAKVQPELARALALRACPGKIAFEQLQMTDKGGLRYVFIVERPQGPRRRVAIDAQSGATLEMTDIQPSR